MPSLVSFFLMDSRGNRALAELHQSSYSILRDGDALLLIANNKKNDGDNEHLDAILAFCPLIFPQETGRKLKQQVLPKWKRILEAKEKEREARQKVWPTREEDSKTDEADYDPYTGEEGYDSADDENFYKLREVIAAKRGLQDPEDEKEEKLEEDAEIEDHLGHDEVLNILDDIFAGGAEAQETFRHCCALFAGW